MNNNRFFNEEEVIEINRIKEEIRKVKSDLKIFKETLKIDISNIIYYGNINCKKLNNEENLDIDFSIGSFKSFPKMIFELKVKIANLESELFLIENRNIEQLISFIEQIKN
ncbi:MAG: hypothetical protein AM1032_000357 [Mycoplasmataceae bacterium]|nr:MAG: hypothetical protein AM1032_000357 [Mycoplasmataceae bacterium]